LICNLREGVPTSIDIPNLKHKISRMPKSEKENPLNVVLIQEIQRYNILLNTMRISLNQLEMGIKGIVVISPDLEIMMTSLNAN